MKIQAPELTLLSRRMKNQSISTAELSRRSGVSVRALNLAIKGKNEIKLENANKIAAALNITCAEEKLALFFPSYHPELVKLFERIPPYQKLTTRT
jgi:transcriptional regulator with XRE-family HTH domain